MVAQKNVGALQDGNLGHLQHGGGSLESNILMVGHTIGLSTRAQNYDLSKYVHPT